MPNCSYTHLQIYTSEDALSSLWRGLDSAFSSIMEWSHGGISICTIGAALWARLQVKAVILADVGVVVRKHGASAAVLNVYYSVSSLL